MAKTETVKKDKAEGCCGGLNCGGSSTTYLAVIFLFGLAIGGLAGYWYLTGQQPSGGDVCTPGFASTNNSIVETAVSFITNELASEGITIKAEGVSESLSAKAVKIGIYSGTEKLQTSTIYIINNTILVLSGYDISKYVPSKTSSKPPVTSTMPKSDKPEVKLFVMSFCPYGKDAETAIKPVVELLGDKASIEPHFVIYDNFQGGSDKYCMGEGKYCSMHGIDELKEDVRQMCVWKYDKAKWWPYVDYVNTKCSLGNIATCWKDAANATGVDVTKIEDCETKEALDLLASEAALNTKYGITGSPTVLINDAAYSGARTPEGYKSGICSAFNTAPTECGTALDATGAAATGGCG